MQRRLFTKAVITGIISLFLYVLIVIITTPNFPPIVAVSIALRLNGIYIVGIAASVAVQTLIVGYGKMLGCELPSKKASGMNIFGSAVTSFFSFFSLVAVGCCGTWLYILSFLPALLGLGASGAMIRYSTLFAQLGLGFMILTNLYGFLTLRRKRKKQLQLSFLNVDSNAPSDSLST